MHSEPRQPAMRLELQTLGTLNPFERAADRKRLTCRGFQSSTGIEVSRGFVGPAKSRERQAAEVIGPWVVAAGLDGGGQQLVGFFVVVREVRMDAPSIHLLQERILPEAR